MSGYFTGVALFNSLLAMYYGGQSVHREDPTLKPLAFVFALSAAIFLWVGIEID